MTRAPFKHHFVILISLATMLGMALHETKADLFATTLIGLPTIVVTYGGLGAVIALQNEAHTHVEHFSVSSVRATHQTTYVPPRYLQQKKHLLQNKTTKGRHPFDNYSLPMVS